MSWLSWRLDEWREWLRRKTCSHFRTPSYEEIRTEHEGRVYWSAALFCPKCGEVLSVEASFYGDPKRVLRAIEGEVKP